MNGRLFPLFALACLFVPATAGVFIGLLPLAHKNTQLYSHKFSQGYRVHRGEGLRYMRD
jgi:hypothetical protein